MASITLKAAYMLFLIFSFIWLSVLLMVCFPSGVWSVPVKFPNYSMLMLFLGSGIVASVSCLIIGLYYLGLDLRLKHRSKEVAPTYRSPKTVPLTQLAIPASMKEAELQDSTRQEETIDILVPPRLEEEQVVD